MGRGVYALRCFIPHAFLYECIYNKCSNIFLYIPKADSPDGTLAVRETRIYHIYVTNFIMCPYV